MSNNNPPPIATSSSTDPNPPRSFSLPYAIGSLVLGRFAVDMAIRAPVPFLSDITAVFGQSSASTGWLATAMGLALLIAPFTGMFAHRFGQRRMVFVGLGLFVLVCAVLPLAPNISVVMGLFVLMGIGKALLDPQVQAFVGEHVPYARRGTVIGIVELSWALSWAVGVPMFGLMFSRVSWWAPFWVIGAVALLGILTIRKNAYAALHPASEDTAESRLSLRTWREVFAAPRARDVLLYGIMLFIAAQIPYLVYPLWFKQHFALSVESLGYVSIVLSFADLIAELMTIALVDRIGKRRSVLIACAGFVLAFGAFWALRGSLIGMLAALCAIYLCFEYTLVAALPVASEVVPKARSTMMGFFTASAGTGRIIGSLIAVPLFGVDGERLWLVALVGGVAAALAFVFAIRMTHGDEERAAGN